MKKIITTLLTTGALFSVPSYAQDVEQEQAMCLAKNIYHEARGESMLGQQAVALTTINRANDKRWPATYCGVIYQAYQFSWTLKRADSGKWIPMSKEELEKLHEPKQEHIEVAENVYFGTVEDFTNGANHYWACSGKNRIAPPKWAVKKYNSGDYQKFDNHCFIKL